MSIKNSKEETIQKTILEMKMKSSLTSLKHNDRFQNTHALSGGQTKCIACCALRPCTLFLSFSTNLHFFLLEACSNILCLSSDNMIKLYIVAITY